MGFSPDPLLSRSGTLCFSPKYVVTCGAVVDTTDECVRRGINMQAKQSRRSFGSLVIFNRPGTNSLASWFKCRRKLQAITIHP